MANETRAKQNKYEQGLAAKGLAKFSAIVPKDAIDALRKKTTELREKHLKGEKK